ncbi:MAG: hypothetical protein HY320_10185 [Armatimonadetes bacterium]|nr:hypothetical protein [Armatimonadota bacterium]
MADAGEQFGVWLRDTVAHRHLTLSQIARLAGCDYTYLWRLAHPEARSGRAARPSYEMACRIGAALGTPEEALIAAGYGSATELPTARVADRLSRVEQELAAIRRALAGEAATPAGEVRPSVRLPLLGQIQAGEVHEALEAPGEWVELPAATRAAGDFVLRVRGNSMSPTLLDGDMVVIRRADVAEPGQIVAALVGDEVTLKRFDLRSGIPELVPDNEDWAALRCGPEVRILGIVTGCYRPADVLQRRRR